MRRRHRFTSKEICRDTRVRGAVVRSLIRRLVGAGVIRREAARHIGRQDSCDIYAIADAVHLVPRAVDDMYHWQCQAWQAMRIMRRFGTAEILRGMQSEIISYRILARWIRALESAGYVRVSGRKVPGRPVTWQLVRDTGPLPPLPDELQEGRDA